MLAAQGYCVICIDSRGSRHRGVKFEGHIRCRMGQVELNDQVDALRILADQLGYIDMNRVGIHGWSYGNWQRQLITAKEKSNSISLFI